jgi:hypothetical protein
MRNAANEIARLIEQALGKLKISATQLIDQIAGNQIAPATDSSSGAMSAADKEKLDLYPAIAGLTPGTFLVALTPPKLTLLQSTSTPI